MATPQLRTRAWRDGRLEAHDFELTQLKAYLDQPDGLAWADLCAPDAATLQQLVSGFGFDEHAVDRVMQHLYAGRLVDGRRHAAPVRAE